MTNDQTKWPKAVDWVAPAIKPPLDWQPIRRWTDQSRPRLKESIADHIVGPRHRVVDRTRQMVPTVLQEETVDERLARLAFRPTATISPTMVRGVSPEPEADASTSTNTETSSTVYPLSHDGAQFLARMAELDAEVMRELVIGGPCYQREDGVWVPVSVTVDTIVFVDECQELPPNVCEAMERLRPVFAGVIHPPYQLPVVPEPISDLLADYHATD